MTRPNMDPNAPAVENGCFYGMDIELTDADVILYSLPWDVTTSFRAGTASGPIAMREASYQVDSAHARYPKSSETLVYTHQESLKVSPIALNCRKNAEKILDVHASGQSLTIEHRKQLDEINNECIRFLESNYQVIKNLLTHRIPIISVGGDHSVSYAPIRALTAVYGNLSILHFDAHCDLRKAYEGFTHSHASIFRNVMENFPIHSLVQIGIRDFCPEEIEFARSRSEIHVHFDAEIQSKLLQGSRFDDLCSEWIEQLRGPVYISVDIDGLDPTLCPNTGTPVPGGLSFPQFSHLLQRLSQSGLHIVGGDLVEVSPGNMGSDQWRSSWDSNVGARVLWELLLATVHQKSSHLI